MSDPAPLYVRSPELLSRRAARLLIVDVQEKLVPLIPVRDKLLHNCRRLIEAARILGIPVSATEQYPQGLGKTVPQLSEFLEQVPAKLRFSCAEVLGWGPAGKREDERHQVIVAGMETHVCVLQTAFDLLSLGYRVHVPADAVASRHQLDWRFALERMRDGGAVVTTTEAVLFECCEVSGSAEFKEISHLIKGG